MINTRLELRTAVPADQSRIANLMYFESHVHRHLDWRTPLDWLGSPEYWVLEQNGNLAAALACPPDPETVAWLRLFAVSSAVRVDEAWNALWEAAAGALQNRQLTAAVISMHEWFGELITRAGFAERQKVVVLVHNAPEFRHYDNPHQLVIRAMTRDDLPAVAQLDAAAFGPLWQNSLSVLRYALPQAEISTVGLLNGQIVAYQMSTRNPFGAHLARLAVNPRLQGRSFGYLMVQDLLNNIHSKGLTRLTVNTQHDNSISLALYEKIGFRRTGEQYTVFTRNM